MSEAVAYLCKIFLKCLQRGVLHKVLYFVTFLLARVKSFDIILIFGLVFNILLCFRYTIARVL